MFDSVCLQEHGQLLKARSELQVNNDNLFFFVCPRGGCTRHLNEEQAEHFTFLHHALGIIVRKSEASKRNISADPLVLRFFSPTLNAYEHALVTFSTKGYPIDIVFALLSPTSPLPRVVALQTYELQFSQPDGIYSIVSMEDSILWVYLAKKAIDWTISSLFLGNVGSSLAVFTVDGAQPWDADTLFALQKQADQERLALRAARVAQGLIAQGRKGPEARGPKRKGRGKGRGRTNKKRDRVPDVEEDAISVCPPSDSEQDFGDFFFH